MITLGVFCMLLIVVNSQSTDFDYTDMTSNATTINGNTTPVTTVISYTATIGGNSTNSTVGSTGVNIQQHSSIAGILFLALKYIAKQLN
jgi:hypothetical protein